jgi:hypothetical protein
MADKPAPSQDHGLQPFENIATQLLDSWKPIKLLGRQIAKLSKDGLKGINTINCWISRRIQPL